MNKGTLQTIMINIYYTNQELFSAKQVLLTKWKNENLYIVPVHMDIQNSAYCVGQQMYIAQNDKKENRIYTWSLENRKLEIHPDFPDGFDASTITIELAFHAGTPLEKH